VLKTFPNLDGSIRRKAAHNFKECRRKQNNNPADSQQIRQRKFVVSQQRNMQRRPVGLEEGFSIVEKQQACYEQRIPDPFPGRHCHIRIRPLGVRRCSRYLREESEQYKPQLRQGIPGKFAMRESTPAQFARRGGHPLTTR